MSEKIKVGNAEVEKANYDYFSLMYEKISKEYVVADLVSKCEDYDKLYKNYEMKDLQIEEIRKELINQDKYIGKLKEEYDKEIERLNNIIKNAIEYIKRYETISGYYDSNYDGEADTYSHDNVKDDLLQMLDKDSDK